MNCFFEEGLLYLKGHHLSGKYKFSDRGEADQNIMYLVGGGYNFVLGCIVMNAKFFEFTEEFKNLSTNRNVYDLVFGFWFRTPTKKTGVCCSLIFLVGSRVLEKLRAYARREPMPFVPVSSVVEFEVGYRFIDLPIALKVGYDAWSFQSEVKWGDQILNDDVRGATLKFIYMFR